MEAFNSHMAETFGDTFSWSEGDTEGVADVPMLKPILGKEISSVQFRNLEEQRYLAMVALYDQEQRQCVVRLVGMHEPVNLFTPFVEEGFSSNESRELYIAESYQNWPALVLPADEATRLVEQRRREIEELVQRRLEHKIKTQDPVPISRRVGAPKKR